MNDAINGAAPARKNRAPPVPVTVTAIEQVTPKLLRLAFTGEQLGSFALAKPAAHMKLFFPEWPWPPEGGVENAPRPPSRTYTPRRFDPDTSTLEIEFVLHGSGLASDWAARAKVGDPMLVTGPGGGYALDEAMTRLVILADETAMPAAGMILEAISPHCEVTIICEVAGPSEQRALGGKEASRVTWLHRHQSEPPGAQFLAAIEAIMPAVQGAHWWVACEALAMRRIRDRLLSRHGVAKHLLHTRGYWMAGASNHPDHDYGAD